MGAPTSWALFLFATTSLCIVASERSNSNPILSIQDESGTQIAPRPPLSTPADDAKQNALTGISSEERDSSSEPIALVKRAPSGFMGMRGKKDRQLPDDSNEMDAARDRIIFNYLKHPAKINQNDGPHDYAAFGDLWKRAPSGFLGMRGKKRNEELWDDADDDDLDNEMDFEDRLANENEILYNLESLEDRLPKRAPSGFMGMRGKKRYSDEFFDGKRAPSGFMGMRGKKLFSSPQYLDGKRAPSGFMGMRGKRYFDDEISEEEVKRGASSGFVGMRGKKSNENDFLYDDQQKIDSMELRGVRGKKDVSDVLAERPRLQSFFALRGKKQPSNNGFFGMRGKKGPFSEFRGKFVGVRGKKNPSYEKLMKLAMEMDDVGTGLQPATLVNSEIGANKRLPSGFLGARGKKWSERGSIQP